MTQSTDPIPEADLIDYANGTLSMERRITVAAALERDPVAAADMMTQMRLRDELKLAMQAASVPSSPGARRHKPFALVAVFGAACIGAMLSLGILTPDVPDYVNLARYSHANSQLRLAILTQIETPEADLAEIQTATGIRLPNLPADWRILDVQVYPSPLGPSVEMAVMTDDNGLLSLFAVRHPSDSTSIPTALASSDVPLAYFQISGTGYVLVGASAPDPLDDEAQLLFNTLI